LYLKQIEQLVALQKVDNEIFGIRGEMENAPKEVEALRVKVKELEDQRGHSRDKLTHLKEQARRLDLDIDTDTGKIKKSKNKLMQVGNAKEYHAMVREMDSLEKINRSREEERMALLEELERQKNIQEDLDTQFNALDADLSEKEAGLGGRLDTARNTLDELGKERVKTGREVPAPVLARYEFIRQRLSHPVIVAVRGGVCSGCHIAIPPQHFIELQKGAQILSCPNCQRLIYWSGHFQS
jgi:predicted  nucleic acid-binding Zn-ribbon protein